MSKQAQRHGFVIEFYPLGLTVSEIKRLFYLLLPYEGAVTHLSP